MDIYKVSDLLERVEHQMSALQVNSTWSVYDVTASRLWKNGSHVTKHAAATI